MKQTILPCWQQMHESMDDFTYGRKLVVGVVRKEMCIVFTGPFRGLCYY